MCISGLFIVEFLIADTTREHSHLLLEVVELAPEIFRLYGLIYKVPPVLKVIEFNKRKKNPNGHKSFNLIPINF